MTTTCTNCGADAADIYCARCGEQQPGHHDLTVKHFVHDVWHELVHVDSKLFTTLKLLVTKPGFLTQEYFAGRKKRYIAPIRLFLTLFAIQFLAYTAYKPAAMYSIEKFGRFDTTGKLQQKLETKAKKYEMSYDAYTERIDHRWQKNLSLLQFVNIVGLALVLKLVYFRRYLVQHLVFAAHYLAFTYLFGLVIVFPIYAIAGFEPGPVLRAVIALGVTVHVIYLFFAMRRYYTQRRGEAVLKTGLVFAGTYVISVTLILGSLIAALIQYG